KEIERTVELELAVGGDRAQLGRGLVGIARDREEALDQRARLLRQRGLRAERRLLEEAVRDLAHGTSADRADAGDREQIGDQRARALRVGAPERRQHALILR